MKTTGLANLASRRLFILKVVMVYPAICLWVACSLFFLPTTSVAQEKQLSIAVAPFKNLMKIREIDWMCEGFAESITTKLNYVRRLILVERVQLNELIQEIQLGMSGITEANALNFGKLLNADFLVIGSFQKLDIKSVSTLKINVRVVNVSTGQIERGKAVSTKGPFESVFDMQDTIAAKLANNLGVGVTEEEMRNMKTDETVSVVAYELYNQARNEKEARREHFLNRALKYDPNYAKAHLLLGSCYNSRSMFDGSLEAPALAHLNKALELDPSLTEAHYALGDHYYRKRNDYRATEDQQEKDAITKMALYHFEIFIDCKKDSKAKYYIWKVEKAMKKVKKMKS